jgi:glycosyltransferase involved in cell wall biosynthesis
MVTTVPLTLRGFLLPFANHFRAKGWQVDAMALDASAMPECFPSYDNIFDVSFSRNPLARENLKVAPQQIQEALEREDYDIVHVHTAVAAFVTRYALRNLKKARKPKLLYTVHGFHFFKGNKFHRNVIYLILEKIAAPWTDYMVVINKEDEEAALRHRLIPKERLYYMPGIGVDLKYYNPENVSDEEIKSVRDEMGLTPNDALFLASAEFNPGKRHRDMLNAFARLARPNVHLAFAGAGPLFDEMKQLAVKLGIHKQVHFLGYRKDMTVLMRASLATIMASEREGLPRSIMESLCLEVPVIGTKIRGIRDLLTGDSLTGGYGVLVNLGDTKSIADGMAWILDNPSEARLMGKRGREYMRFYDVQNVIKLHEELYAEITNKKPVLSHKS